MKILVGHTGFVGSNLCSSFCFDGVYNSANIKCSYGTNPDMLVYSGVKAEMFLANKYPIQDKLAIDDAIFNIKKINPKFLVLISTISVYESTLNVDENYKIDNSLLQPYGNNRYYLEDWVRNNFQNYLIVRLPALYGNNLKKNFIFDFINVIPSLINELKFSELKLKEPILCDFYFFTGNGFFKCKEINTAEKLLLKNIFETIGFNALYFTDSRAKFQFYNLNFLWRHIEIAISKGIKLLNVTSEPIQVSELYYYLTAQTFKNEIHAQFPNQDVRSLYYNDFGGYDGYMLNKEFILEDIRDFVSKKSCKE